jgi:Bacteriophage tail sheath protein
MPTLDPVGFRASDRPSSPSIVFAREAKMPEHVVPGVFVEEIPSGVGPIEGVATSTAAFVGATAEGPLEEPTLVTSLADYSRAFGGVSAGHPVSTAVRSFFENGGGRAFVARTASASSGAGTRDLVDAFSP